MKLNNIPDSINSICFDAFGTLLEATKKNHPFANLFSGKTETDRKKLKYRLMTEKKTLRSWYIENSPMMETKDIEKLELALENELHSIELRNGISDTWNKLQKKGYKIGVCSNLAQAYSEVILNILPTTPDALIFSCEVGIAKPEPAIYKIVTRELGGCAGNIMFVGDNYINDIDSPKKYGMLSMHIDEFLQGSLDIY